MILTPDKIEAIKQEMPQINQIQDFSEALAIIYKHCYQIEQSELNITHKLLTFFAFASENRYRTFEIPKKNGKLRTISAPIKPLKQIQQCINVYLNLVFKPHESATGFVLGKSIADNAKQHISRKFVYNIDLQDFFPSISFRRVKSVLGLKPFNFKDELEPVAFLIANLCSENDGLPQGAPTSPTITNIVCQRLDKKLARLAKSYRATYTRYADDITFSCNKNQFEKDSSFMDALYKIIAEEDFQVNPAKERLQNHLVRQEVTGIIVNQKLNVSRSYYKTLRYWLRTWEKFGHEAAKADFQARYITEKGFVRHDGKIPPFESVLAGKLMFLGMVKGKEDAVYLKLQTQFQKLLSPSLQKTNDLETFSHLLETWETEGIETAIQLWDQTIQY